MSDIQVDNMGKELLPFLNREIENLKTVEHSYENYPHNPAKYTAAGRRQEAERIKMKVLELYRLQEDDKPIRITECLEQLSAYKATNLLPEEIKLLQLTVGCWLKDEKRTGALISELRTRVDKVITELTNVKNGHLGDKSIAAYIQEIIDQLETEQEGAENEQSKSKE